MKKMLAILSSIIVLDSTSSIIACEFDSDEKEYISKEDDQLKISDELEENSVFSMLENGIDADFLTTKDNGLAAENAIQNEALKIDLSISSLKITDEIEQNLNEGNNEFNVEVVIDNKKSKFKTTVKNVQSGELSEDEIQDEAETLIDQEAEIPVHSSTDNTPVAEAIEERLHSIGEKEAEVEIVKEDNNIADEITDFEKVSFAATNSSPWILKVTKLNNPKHSSIKKHLNFSKIKTINVSNAASDKEKEKIAFKELTKILNDSSFDLYKVLSTANTFNQAGDIAREIAEISTENMKDLKISHKLNNGNDLLQINNNKFQLDFQYQNNPLRKIDVVLNNITDIQNDKKFSLKVIKKEFEKGIETPHLYGWNTVFDALNYFQSEATKINKNAYVKLSKDFINKKEKIKVWKNEITKKLKKSSKSISSIPADLIIDMATYSPNLIHKVITDSGKVDLNPILTAIRNHSNFYLSGAKEEIIELEVVFENPFDTKKANKNEKKIILLKIKKLKPIK